MQSLLDVAAEQRRQVLHDEEGGGDALLRDAEASIARAMYVTNVTLASEVKKKTAQLVKLQKRYGIVREKLRLLQNAHRAAIECNDHLHSELRLQRQHSMRPSAGETT